MHHERCVPASRSNTRRIPSYARVAACVRVLTVQEVHSFMFELVKCMFYPMYT